MNTDKWECTNCDNDDAVIYYERAEYHWECDACGMRVHEFDPDSYTEEEWDTIANSYPDGWTCVACGDEYYNCLPPHDEDGTLCHECWLIGS